MRARHRPHRAHEGFGWLLAGYAGVAGFFAPEVATRQRGRASSLAWSMRTLGGSYTRTLRTDDAQEVIDSGPHAWVRHPGYAGSLLVWTGFALTSRSVPVVVAVDALLRIAYHRRIGAVEAMLRRELRGYSAYRERTKDVIRLVW